VPRVVDLWCIKNPEGFVLRRGGWVCLNNFACCRITRRFSFEIASIFCLIVGTYVFRCRYGSFTGLRDAAYSRRTYCVLLECVCVYVCMYVCVIIKYIMSLCDPEGARIAEYKSPVSLHVPHLDRVSLHEPPPLSPSVLSAAICTPVVHSCTHVTSLSLICSWAFQSLRISAKVQPNEKWMRETATSIL